jgi:hypothetical protein
LSPITAQPSIKPLANIVKTDIPLQFGSRMMSAALEDLDQGLVSFSIETSIRVMETLGSAIDPQYNA